MCPGTAEVRSDAGLPAPAGAMADIACSASAVIVSDGLTPGLAGIAAPSQTSMFT